MLINKYFPEHILVIKTETYQSVLKRKNSNIPVDKWQTQYFSANNGAYKQKKKIIIIILTTIFHEITTDWQIFFHCNDIIMIYTAYF